MNITVKNIKKYQEYNLNQGFLFSDTNKLIVYIGRPSPLGNPWGIKESSRQQVIQQFRRFLWKELKTPNSRVSEGVWNIVNYCRKTNIQEVELVCFCYPLACHGDVIKSCLEWIFENNLVKESKCFHL